MKKKTEKEFGQRSDAPFGEAHTIYNKDDRTVTAVKKSMNSKPTWHATSSTGHGS